MPITIGTATRAGFRREAITTATLWPAAAPALVTSLLPLLSVAPNVGPEKRANITTHSPYAPAAYDLQHIAPSVSVSLQLRYQGFEQLWACALGHMAGRIGGVLMPETLAAGAYRHLYEVDARLGSTEQWVTGDGWLLGDGIAVGQRKIRRGTLALDYAWGVLEVLSGMVSAWSLTADHAGVTLTLDFAGHSVSYSSAVNTPTTLRKLAPPYAPRLLFPQCVFRIAPYSSVTALNSGNEAKVTSWALRVENNLGTSFGPRTGTAPEEYERRQVPTVTLTFVLPRHEAATWGTRWASNAVLMADAKWTGGAIGGTGQNYQCNVYLPSMQVTNSQPPVSGPGVVSETVQCVAVEHVTAAAGMPTMNHLGPIAVELVNSINSHPLVAA